MAESPSDDLRIAYDSNTDVLYVSIGNPKPAICDTLDSGVVIRYDEETEDVIGFTIINFLRRFSIKSEPITVNLLAQFKATEAETGFDRRVL